MNNKRDESFSNISPVNGIVDTSPHEYILKKYIIDRTAQILNAAGYDMADYPVIEPTELFVRKSGGGITGRLYSFIDPGGNRVSLRPEFTSSVIRSYLKEPLPSGGVLKRQYVGPVFRYSDVLTGNPLRQFTQQGCERIGPGSLVTDAEILRLALESLSMSGIKKITVKIGNIGAIRDLLERHGLGEALCMYVFSNLRNLSENPVQINSIVSRAAFLGLVSRDERRQNMLEGGSRDQSSELIQSLMRESLSGNTGRRSRSEIVDRLLKRTSELINVSALEEALTDLSSFLIEMTGTAPINSEEIGEGKGENSKQKQYINELIQTVGDVQGIDVNYSLNFASQRGLTYYTGFIFDLVKEDDPNVVSLGGGGRYDSLVRSLGGVADQDAVGFAINVDSLDRYIEPVN